MRSQTVAALVSGTLLAMTAACDAPTPEQTQNCTLEEHSTSNQYQLNYQLLLPHPCPAPLAFIGELKDAAGKIKDEGAINFSFSEIKVYNSNNTRDWENVSRFTVENGINTSSPRVQYQAGTAATAATSPLPNSVTDFGRFTAFNSGGYTRTDNPYGVVRIGYRNSPVSASIGGEDVPPANTSQTWNANPSGGSIPYSYTWYRDGIAVGTGSSYTTNVGASSFGLKLIALDASGIQGAAVMAVDVNGVRASLGGPDMSWYSQGGATWSVSGRGGSAPYSYEWFVDDLLVGSGTSWTGYPGVGEHTLHVQMTDAGGAKHSAAMQVQGLGDEGCAPPFPYRTC